MKRKDLFRFLAGLSFVGSAAQLAWAIFSPSIKQGSYARYIAIVFAVIVFFGTKGWTERLILIVLLLDSGFQILLGRVGTVEEERLFRIVIASLYFLVAVFYWKQSLSRLVYTGPSPTD